MEAGRRSSHNCKGLHAECSLGSRHCAHVHVSYTTPPPPTHPTETLVQRGAYKHANMYTVLKGTSNQCVMGGDAPPTTGGHNQTGGGRGTTHTMFPSTNDAVGEEAARPANQ